MSNLYRAEQLAPSDLPDLTPAELAAADAAGRLDRYHKPHPADPDADFRTADPDHVKAVLRRLGVRR